MHYTCIACIPIDFVMKMNKKNYLQVYLEESKYKIKKIQMSRFTNAELESNSDSESDSEELMTKLESNSDSDSEQDIFVGFEQIILLLIAEYIVYV